MQRIITNLKQICDPTMRNLYKFVEGDGKKPVNLIQLKFVAAAWAWSRVRQAGKTLGFIAKSSWLKGSRKRIQLILHC